MNSNPYNGKRRATSLELLREKAEEQLARVSMQETASRSTEELLHELHVHQVELEMQNEELRSAHVTMEESRDRYANLYEFAPVGYLTLTRDGMITEANLTCASLLGMERKKLLHRRFDPCVAPQDRDRWHRLFVRVLKHEVRQTAELLLQRPDSTDVHAYLDCMRVEAGGEPAVIRIVLTDMTAGEEVRQARQAIRDGQEQLRMFAANITEHKLTEQALHDANHRKDEFLAMLAHELRNPLTPIRNAVQIIGRLGLEEPRRKWAQEVIENQVAHLTHIVDDLLDVSRVTCGKIVLQKETVELVALAKQVMASVRLTAEEKGHQLTLRLPSQPVWLEGDPVRLSQVLFNLLDNAIKYTPDGGQIEFDARVAGQEIAISVRDNGAGIAPALLPRVFDLFQQEERTLDRAQGGLGIGLTLVQRLVGMHYGRVEAHSAGLGKGSTFTVALPVRDAPAPLADSAAQAGGSPAAGTRVLVVDDDFYVADSTAMLLEMEGYEARIAYTGEDALALAQEYRPQVVLLDIGLKGMDGFETAKRLRALPEGRDLCLVAVTGYGDAKTKADTLNAGCDHFMVKPMEWDALNKILAAALL